MGKYLGLPEYFGRKKKDLFSSVVDKIIQKASHWSTRFLSSAGKLVLLKSVLSAMPTYTMSCFKIPISLCKRIQSALTRFWWDNKPGKRKLCWVAWERLTLPKSLGGLGFRDIERFNDSLLAKLTWRLLKHPDSLLAQVLFSKYCSEAPLMSCQAPTACSHGWTGILAGREILRLGLGWLVGDGSSINLWTEPWLSVSYPTLPLGPAPLAAISLKVSDLINPAMKTWDLDAIRLLLPHHESTIRQIYLSTNTTEDVLAWLPEKSGSYTTKSGYSFSKAQYYSAPRDNFRWKHHIWNLKIPPKLHTFLWKLKSNALPIGTNLSTRGIRGDISCKRCGQEETAIHIINLCPFASQVWLQLPISAPAASLQPTNLDSFFDQIHSRPALPPCGITTPLSPWIAWQLWKTRNSLLFENRSYSVTEVSQKIMEEAKAWHDAQTSKPECHIPRATYPPPALSPTTHVCYVDAAWLSSSLLGGMGWCFLDPQGTILTQGSTTHRFTSSALLAEAIAIKAALEAASRYEIQHLTVYSDSHSLVSLLNSKGEVNELRSVLVDIRCLLQSFASISICFIPRTANVLADSIAKSALVSLSPDFMTL